MVGIWICQVYLRQIFVGKFFYVYDGRELFMNKGISQPHRDDENVDDNEDHKDSFEYFNQAEMLNLTWFMLSC